MLSTGDLAAPVQDDDLVDKEDQRYFAQTFNNKAYVNSTAPGSVTTVPETFVRLVTVVLRDITQVILLFMASHEKHSLDEPSK